MRSASLFALGGLAVALAVDAYLLFADTYHGRSCHADSNGQVVCVDVSHSFLEENGSEFIVLLVIPTLLALAISVLTLPAVRLTRFFLWLAVVAFFGFCLITGFGIGLLYAPAMLLCLLAAILIPREPELVA